MEARPPVYLGQPLQPVTHKAVFPQTTVIWLGNIQEGELHSPLFVVQDIIDGGVSEYQVTGRRPNLRVPVQAIRAEGGEVMAADEDID